MRLDETDARDAPDPQEREVLPIPLRSSLGTTLSLYKEARNVQPPGWSLTM